MKSVLLFMILMSGYPMSGYAQQEQLHSAEYNRIESERRIIYNELIQLRDSITISMQAVDSKIHNASHSQRVRLKASRKELESFKYTVEFDLAEIMQTRRNDWSRDSIERILMATKNTRLEFKRIYTLL